MVKAELHGQYPIHCDSGAFPMEYGRDTFGKSLLKDIHAYLGEYRYEMQKSPYELEYSHGHLRDIYGHESMRLKGEKAIVKKISQNKNSIREEAELSGIISLDLQLQNAKVGDTIVWISPPGSKTEGYGDYGFFFLGKVDNDDGEKKHLDMTAIRINNPQITQCNETLALLTGIYPYFQNAEDFLAHPFVLKQLNINPERVLQSEFNYQYDNQHDLLFYKSIAVLHPVVEEFISMVKRGESKETLRNYFNAIENLAEKLKETNGQLSITQLDPMYLIQQFGYKPRSVGGSCGSSGEHVTIEDLLSANIFTKFSFLKDALDDSSDFEPFHCPNPECDIVIYERVRGNNCPKCGYSKADYIADGGSAC